LLHIPEILLTSTPFDLWKFCIAYAYSRCKYQRKKLIVILLWLL
jgi:hypothetical protein